MTLNEALNLTVTSKDNNVDPPIKVRFKKNVYWSDGETNHLHATKGQTGTVVANTGAGLLTIFDNLMPAEGRQVMYKDVHDELEEI